MWTRPHTDGDGTFASNGTMGFSGLITSGTTNANGGLNMADFVLGLPATFNQAGSQINNQSINAIGLYVGDVWRAGRKVTLNYGIRWEPYLAAKDDNGFQQAFSRENFDKGIRSIVYPNAPVGLMFKGDPGFPGRRLEQQQPARAVRAARRHRVGSDAATTSRRFAPASVTTTTRRGCGPTRDTR